MKDLLQELHQIANNLEEAGLKEAAADTHAIFIRVAARTLQLTEWLKAARHNIKAGDLASELRKYGFTCDVRSTQHLMVSHPLFPREILTLSTHYKGKAGIFNPSNVNELIRLINKVNAAQDAEATKTRDVEVEPAVDEKASDASWQNSDWYQKQQHLMQKQPNLA